jgi:hypothetical protein
MAKKKEIKEASTEAEKIVVPAVRTQLDNLWLKGPIKEIMMTTYKAHLKEGAIVQGKIELQGVHEDLNYIKFFDKDGHETNSWQYGGDSSHINVYDDKGHKTENQLFIKGKHLCTNFHKFNQWGHLSEMKVTDADGRLMYRTFDNYSDDGKKLDHTHYMGLDERIIASSKNTYNEQGKLLSDIHYNEKGEIKQQTIYKYDEHGNCLEYSIEYMEDNMKNYTSKTTHVFNDHNDVIETTMYDAYGNVKHNFKNTPEYDNEGKRILPVHKPYIPKEPDLEAGETEDKELDSHGNWIKKTKFYNKLPVYISYREIKYYDDKSAKNPAFIHAVTTATKDEIIVSHEPPKKLSGKEARWLMDGQQTSAENFQAHRYYAIRFKDAPSVINFSGPYTEPFALYEELMENMDAEEVHSYCTVHNGHQERMARYSLTFRHHEGYLLTANGFGGQDEDDFNIPTGIRKHIEDYVYTSQIQFLRPSLISGKRDESFEEQIAGYIDDCTYTKKPDQPTINMIEVNNNGFVMEEHDVDDSFEIRDLDVNYGYGFEKFHNELMGRFNNGTKGLVLFHGLPGTGKTYYIRHLLREMANSKKEVIYMPPNMVDHLTEPAFMTFLSGEIREWSQEGKFCVLLIEDAEPLLAKRQEGVRIQGVTNLLNMTDGLLNDMLNLQIICTFNVDLKKLDSALLRPGRLIARKEFKALNELDANLLAQRLGIKHHFKKPATLGEIYSFGKNMSTLIHDVEADRDASTNIDDL